jgi:uncharacterized protein
MDAPLASLLDSEKARQFAANKIAYSELCSSCKWVDLCNGGCQKDRLRPDGGPGTHSYLCEGYKLFFLHAHDELVEIRDRLVKAARKSARAAKVVKKR